MGAPALNTCFGFTEAEALLDRRAKEHGSCDALAWYNGDVSGEQVVHNPWSISAFFERRQAPAGVLGRDER
ncbi:hypothetical protein [Sorangium sp. So ce1335]|uniref:hypothetical protein n=1 Tax=Sorangium sp. So ce1335 TaxID=3133335 RepID=UPI003F64508E